MSTIRNVQVKQQLGCEDRRAEGNANGTRREAPPSGESRD
jgi:hypothetical protein